MTSYLRVEITCHKPKPIEDIYARWCLCGHSSYNMVWNQYKPAENTVIFRIKKVHLEDTTKDGIAWYLDQFDAVLPQLATVVVVEE